MAFISLPAPGTKLGPCEDGCTHVDCAAARKEAETICELCKNPIGYEAPFSQEGIKLVHFKCLMIHL